MTDFNADELAAALKAVREFRLPDATTVASLRSNSRGLRKFLNELAMTQDHLLKLDRAIDHILIPDHVFDLGKPETVAEVIVHKLELQGKEALASLRPFYGSGIYCLYYEGELPVYEAVSGTDCPIYVGSSSPEKHNAPDPRSQGTKLYDRMLEHLNKSIRPSHNLKEGEFSSRYLVVQSGYEKAAEVVLIRRYWPAWNKESKVCSGIGKHGDAARTELSAWDVMHSGRRWSSSQSSLSKKTPTTVTNQILAHFEALLAKDRPTWTKRFKPSWIAKQPA